MSKRLVKNSYCNDSNVFTKCVQFRGNKIEYERLVKALDEGDMKTVMSASDDGYAYVKEETSESTYEEKEDGEHSRIIYQTTHGVYNVKEDDLYGETTQKVVTDIKMIKRW